MIFDWPICWRRVVTALCLLLLATAAPASAQSGVAVLSAAELRVGVERLAKLQFERQLASEADRAGAELLRERSRIEAVLLALSNDNSLNGRRRGQIRKVGDDAESLLQLASKPVAQVSSQDLLDCYQSSEALAAQLSFVSTGLSNDSTDSAAAATVDMLTRAATMVLRVGKLNFAAAKGNRSAALVVDARQTLTEFKSALDAIGAWAQTDAHVRAELDLVRNQWIMFSAALNADGLAKEAQRLPQVATTTDRIAQSLMTMARRVVQVNEASRGAARSPRT